MPSVDRGSIVVPIKPVFEARRLILHLQFYEDSRHASRS